MNNNEELKTSFDWSRQSPSVTIMDPDGWDRSNYQYSFHEELISLQEFNARRDRSTCITSGLGLGKQSLSGSSRTKSK